MYIGSVVYSSRTNDSLKISHGKWFRWSTGIGGVSALDYLIKVRDMSFVDAVLHLCDCLRFEPPQKSYTPIKVIAMTRFKFILNATDVASILGISRAFAYNLFHANDFPVIVIGSRRLVNKDSFINWLNQKEGVEG